MFFVMLAGLTLFAPFLAHHVREKFALQAFQSRSVTEHADSKGCSSPPRLCERSKQSTLLAATSPGPSPPRGRKHQDDLSLFKI